MDLSSKMPILVCVSGKDEENQYRSEKTDEFTFEDRKKPPKRWRIKKEKR